MTLFLHIIIDSWISADFVEFINLNFDSSLHRFVCITNSVTTNIDTRQTPNNIIMCRTNFEIIRLLFKCFCAKKIFLHGIFDYKLYILFRIFPILIKKTRWIIWGGDLYQTNYLQKSTFLTATLKFFYEYLRHYLLSKIPEFITYIEGDYDYAVEKFSSKAKYRECIMYPSNLFRDIPQNIINHKSYINILVGNSGSIENRHEEIFQLLQKLDLTHVKIYSVLSYGSDRMRVKQVGEQIFKEKFSPIMDIMPSNIYDKFLAGMDIAIFNHSHQQGMGNLIALLGMGKCVFLRTGTPQWNLCQKMGLTVFNNQEVNLPILDSFNADKNIKIIKNYFNISTLINQYTKLFSD